MRTSIEIEKELDQVTTAMDNYEWDVEEWEKALDAGETEKAKRLEAAAAAELTSLFTRRDELESELVHARHAELKPGDGITIYLFTDSHAYTVIKRTAKTITVRRDKATLDPDFVPEIIPGGFAGHCINQADQKWSYERDPEGKTKTIHWSDKLGRFAYLGEPIGIGRHEFYDYNF